MDEYIERGKVVNWLKKVGHVLKTEHNHKEKTALIGKIIDHVENCPAADVVEVTHGQWIISHRFEEILEMEVVKYTCSVCNEYRLSATGLSQATKYCPNCGARMGGADG